jgi:arylsulfatase
VEARPDADNTVICFFADHGDGLGDHRAWQKESFFEQSTHIPFLVSWPAALPGGERREELACLTDLFGIATHAAGEPEVRDGVDLLGAVTGVAEARSSVIGMYGEPGSSLFKIMVRDPEWKYIYFANGGLEQLFDMQHDRAELHNLVDTHPELAQRFRDTASAACDVPGAREALDEAGDLRTFPLEERSLTRIYQFDQSRGVSGFPERPEDALKAYHGRRGDQL